MESSNPIGISIPYSIMPHSGAKEEILWPSINTPSSDLFVLLRQALNSDNSTIKALNIDVIKIITSKYHSLVLPIFEITVKGGFCLSGSIEESFSKGDLIKPLEKYEANIPLTIMSDNPEDKPAHTYIAIFNVFDKPNKPFYNHRLDSNQFRYPNLSISMKRQDFTMKRQDFTRKRLDFTIKINDINKANPLILNSNVAKDVVTVNAKKLDHDEGFLYFFKYNVQCESRNRGNVIAGIYHFIHKVKNEIFFHFHPRPLSCPSNENENFKPLKQNCDNDDTNQEDSISYDYDINCQFENDDSGEMEEVD